MFKLLLIKEFQRLKEIETNQYNLEWNVKRILSKTNCLKIQNFPPFFKFNLTEREFQSID